MPAASLHLFQISSLTPILILCSHQSSRSRSCLVKGRVTIQKLLAFLLLCRFLCKHSRLFRVRSFKTYLKFGIDPVFRCATEDLKASLHRRKLVDCIASGTRQLVSRPSRNHLRISLPSSVSHHSILLVPQVCYPDRRTCSFAHPSRKRTSYPQRGSRLTCLSSLVAK